MSEDYTIWKHKLGAELEENKAELKKLRAEAEKQSAETKQSILDHIESLEKRRQELDEQFQKMKNASEGAALEIKDGLGNAWSEFQQSFKNAKEKFSKTE